IGGAEQKLAETSPAMASFLPSSCLAWSPDGRSLAIVDRNSQNEPFGIFLLSVETGEKQKLTSPPSDVNGDYFPAFSPDGRALAFVRFRAYFGNGDLLVQQLSSNLNPLGEPRAILRDNLISGPTWTLDGRELIPALRIGYGSYGLWRIAADGSGKRQRLDFA